MGSRRGRTAHHFEGVFQVSRSAKRSLYLADTHSLAWYLLDSSKLSPAADKVFRQIERGQAKLLIPAIVIAELIFIIERGKLTANIDDLLKRIESATNVEICSLGKDQLRCLKEQKAITTMHDRFIVCEALLRQAKLITKDEEIHRAAIVPVVW